MADNVLDSGQGQGTTPTTNSGGSQGGGDQQGSFDAAKLQSTLEAFSKKLDEVDARSKSLQSDKDRGVNQTRKEVDELKRQIAEIEKLKSAGMESNAAIEEFTFREEVRQLREQLGKLNPAAPQPAGNGNGSADATAQVIAAAQLDANDPQVLSLIQQYGNDPMKLAMQAGMYKAQLGNRPTPSPSATPAMSSGSAAPAPDAAQLSDELMQLYKEPSKNMKRIQEISKVLKGA